MAATFMTHGENNDVEMKIDNSDSMQGTEQMVIERPEMDVACVDKVKLAAQKKEEGNIEYSKKNYGTALKLYSEAIELQPANHAYYGNRCACYMMTKDYHNALKDARNSTTYDSRFTKGYQREAKCHMALGSASTARKCLEKALDIDPHNKQIQLDLRTTKSMMEFENQAEDGEKRQDHRKIEYCMRRLSEYAPDCAKFKALQAEAMALQGKVDEAQIIANEILRSDMQNAEALYVRGLCLYYQDYTEKAFKTFQQLFKMDPDFRKAKDIYKKAKLLENTKLKGNEAFKIGKYREALDLYTEALKVDPCNKITNAKIHSNRANVNQKLNKLDDAVEDCNKAIDYDPTFLKPYLRRAKCYMDLENYEEAVRDYEKITKMDKSPEYRQLLKHAKLELKKSKRKDYYKILGVSKTANDDEIKKAYKKEALKHHPDRHSNETEEKSKEEERLFKEVNEAYSILSDKQKRMRYDNGQDLDDNGMDFGDFDPNQIFQAFFGGGGGGGGGGHHHGGGGFSHHSSSNSGGFPGFTFSFG